MSSGDFGTERSWIRSRPSSVQSYEFREGLSRGSQTSTCDFGESFRDDPSQPIATPSVRRSSVILGDLRALYSVNSQAKADEDALYDLPESQQSNRSNPWRKHYNDKILPDLVNILSIRRVEEAKCSSIREKINRRMLTHCFSLWRSNLIRALNADLVNGIESQSTGYFKQRKKSVLQVWGHVALGLNSKKKILERRRGGIERARESLTRRLTEKGDTGMIVTPEMIDAEIRRLMNATLSAWMTGYSLKTYFAMWRDNLRPRYEQTKLSRSQYAISARRKVLVSWLARTKASIDQIEGNFMIDYRRLALANAFRQRKLTKPVMQKWRQLTAAMMGAQQLKRRILTRLVRSCLLEWKSTKNRQKDLKRCTLEQWKDIRHTYAKQPFRCWRNIVENNRCQAGYERKLVDTLLRSQSRRKMYRYFRQWLHQARYGRVTSLYTRNQLASGWLENKRRVDELSVQVKEMASKIDLNDQLMVKVHELEKELKASELARVQAEQSLADSRSMNECLSRVNPICAEHVLALFPLFGRDKVII